MNIARTLRRLGVTLIATLLAMPALAGPAPAAADIRPSLEAGFNNPPNAARPRVWWHWLNGNITKEGIRLDLEWMHRIGLGGFQNFDASLGTPQVVQTRLQYMTPPWQDAFRYAMSLADDLGLEVAIAGSPGWSESGGPWVPPAQGMKKVVWSETLVDGGHAFTGTLSKPPVVSGPYQDLPLFDAMALIAGQAPSVPPDYYADTAVLALRLPTGPTYAAIAPTSARSNRGAVDAAVLADGRLTTRVELPIAPVGESTWIELEYARPEPIQAITYSSGDPINPFAAPSGPVPRVEASDDGQAYRLVATLPMDGAPAHTLSVQTTAARFYRLVFETLPTVAPPPGNVDFAGMPDFGGPPATSLHIAEFQVLREPRINRVEEKAGFEVLRELDTAATPTVAPGDAIPTASIVDLTSKLHADGTLDWTPPAGRWLVLRMGYSLTGVTNHPASPEATGLEVDKLSAPAVRAYMTHYLDTYSATLGPLMGSHGLRCVINDSWEAGSQNWTDDLVAQFMRLRGYDPRPWLATLTGRVIDSAEASDRFLWDLRRTLADLLAANHYDLITDMVHERGLCHYGESHEAGRAFIGDGMEVKRSNDVPMGAMWTQRPGVNEEQFGFNADLRESASVAHLYDRAFVAAESMTAGMGPWAWSPALLKPTVDAEFLAGVNRIIIHTSVHQPLVDRAPGLALGPFGQWFTRNETWAELARPWIDYLARCSYLLQQGRFVADVAYLYGEDSNVTALFGQAAPPIPSGYNFDYVNVDALVHLLSVQDGMLVTASGMRYRVLALDPSTRHLSLAALRKINALVLAGAVVTGPRPLSSPSLADDATEFAHLTDQLWLPGSGMHRVGKGRVYDAVPVAEVLAAESVAEDVGITTTAGAANVRFIHRRRGHTDLYFLVNRSDRPAVFQARFAARGHAPELWHPDTGAKEAADYTMSATSTAIALRLEPRGSVFVVFDRPTSVRARHSRPTQEALLAAIEGPWTLQFETGRGAPDRLVLGSLDSWSRQPDPGIRYFSGTATYEHIITVPAAALHGRLVLDLGDVANLAEVFVNGRSAGILWKPPFRSDITALAHSGQNKLEVRVTNLWPNRMIGDRQPDAAHQYTFAVPPRYTATSPLLPSGLLGPVRLLSQTHPTAASRQP